MRASRSCEPGSVDLQNSAPIVTFAKEAWPFVLPFVVLGAALLAFGHPRWGAAALLVGLLVLLFFRIPSRHSTADAAAILAAADGVVTRVDVVEAADVGPGTFHRVVTFLSVFDVHVQRAPVTGEVKSSVLKRGRKVAAFNPNAGDVNEQQTTVFANAAGEIFGVRQIAGLVARRVVSYVRGGERLERGQLMGVIKFSSRVDLLVPMRYRILVREGDRMRGGVTVVAEPDAPGRQ